jgi:formiminotetrahydrofolate cyclodeaminase
MFAKLTLEEMTVRLSSAEPTPGGGTAAALSALTGAALIEMVVNLSYEKKGLEENTTLYERARHDLQQSRKELLILMDVDAQAFNKVMASFKLPKETPTEKAQRSSAIQTAYYHAALAPVSVAMQACRILEIAAKLLGRINENAASDLFVGSEMARTGLRGALANVAINISSIKEQVKKELLMDEINHLAKRAAAFDLLILDNFGQRDYFNLFVAK